MKLLKDSRKQLLVVSSLGISGGSPTQSSWENYPRSYFWRFLQELPLSLIRITCLWRRPSDTTGNSSRSSFWGFPSRDSFTSFFCRFFLEFLLQISPGVPSGDSSWGSHWGLLQELRLGISPGVSLENSSEGSLWGILQGSPLGIPQEVDFKDSFRGLGTYPGIASGDSSRSFILEFPRRFTQGFFLNISPGVPP